MKSAFIIFALALLGNACGAREDYLKDSNDYQIRNDLAVNGELVFSFQQVFLFRSISIDASQSSACQSFAKDHESKAGAVVIPGTLKITFDEPQRHCARRNVFKQCESYQYVYTFHCNYKVQAE
jgi:hypothetical protein